jgi:radical SAM superfamily enzyme YgiQ (UPF0313 family)
MELKTVLLEHPRIVSSEHYNDVANTPLSNCLISGYVASLLKKEGFNVEIYDSYLSGETIGQCFERLDSMDFNIVGVHAVYSWENTSELFSCLKVLKESKQEISIILYGFFPTFAFQEVLNQYSFIDAVIIGEPEKTFQEFISLFKTYGFAACEKIPGMAFKENGIIRLNRPRSPVQFLDSLPFPLRTENSIKSIGGTILGSRGCNGNCSFCCINPFYGSAAKWRGRSPENIAAEIETILPGLDRKYVYFLDADFFGKGSGRFSRALSISEKIKEFGGVEFGLECRCNDIDDKVLPEMVNSGLKDIFIGIESASFSSLKRMNKSVSTSNSERAINILRSLGIEPGIGFIMFEPDSTLEEIRINFDFLKSNRLLNTLSNTVNVLYHREIILRGMKNYKTLDSGGRLKKNDAIGYEGFYGFSDRSVQFLADLMSVVCRKSLILMENNRSSIYWRRGETNSSGRLNDFLVSFFEDILERLEHRDISLNKTEMTKIQEKASTQILQSAS